MLLFLGTLLYQIAKLIKTIERNNKMHEYFAISVHFVVFYTVFNQKPWHFATFSRKIIRLSDNLGEVMITQRFHHFITRQNYLLVALSWRQIYLRYLIGTNLTRIGNLKVDIARL